MLAANSNQPLSILDFCLFRQDTHHIHRKLEIARKQIETWELFPVLENLLDVVHENEVVFRRVHKLNKRFAQKEYRGLVANFLEREHAGKILTPEEMQLMFTGACGALDVLSYPISPSDRRSIEQVQRIREVIVSFFPIIESLVAEGSKRYEYVYRQVTITEVGVSAVSSSVAFVLISQPNEIYGLYDFDLDFLLDGRVGELSLRKIGELAQRTVHSKTDLRLPAGVPVYLVQSDLTLPHSNVVVPLAARELKRIIARDRI
jgi:hypothetical protein